MNFLFGQRTCYDQDRATHCQQYPNFYAVAKCRRLDRRGVISLLKYLPGEDE